jgi:hypothetical protein
MRAARRARLRRGGLASLGGGLLLVGALVGAGPASAAATPPLDLGTAGVYSVLGGESVTNTGATVLNGNVGVSPGTAISGFPPGVVGGTMHAADAHALQAQSDLTTAYNDAAGRAADANLPVELGGLTLRGGVYVAASSLGLTGRLTLDGAGDPRSVFVFQIGSTLTTASASSIRMINGAQPCNVFWQVGSSATLGTGSQFTGTIMANTSVTLTTGATVQGRALARTGSVTLDTNVFTAPACDTTSTTTTTTTTSSTSTTATTSPATTTGTSATGAATTGTPDRGAPSSTGALDVVGSRTGGVAAGPEAGSPQSGTELPETGASLVGPLLGWAVVLLALGGTLVVLADRRRRRPTRQH